MVPDKPGKYIAREITLGMCNTRMLSTPYEVEVVEGVPNERNHKLLVKTGLKQPKYKSLNCFEWQ
jgi:hypothetical protein